MVKTKKKAPRVLTLESKKLASPPPDKSIWLKKYDNTAPSGKVLNEMDANTILTEIKERFRREDIRTKNLRRFVHTLEALKGYTALGYDSLHDCLKNHFDNKKSISYLYREAKAAQVEKNIVESGSPIGEIPEAVLRELGKLEDPKWQRQAWRAAIKAKKASMQDDGKASRKKPFPTAAEVKKQVQAAASEGATLADSRAAKALSSSPEEQFEKSLQAFATKLKAQLSGLSSAERKSCTDLVVEQLKELTSELRDSQPEPRKASTKRLPKTKGQAPRKGKTSKTGVGSSVKRPEIR